MRKNRGLQQGIALRITTLLVICIVSTTASAGPATYDRAWWNATDTDQRTEFLAGYLDCAGNDLGNKAVANAQWDVIEPEITRYYSTRTETAETVPSLLLRFGSGRPPSTDPAPEVYPGSHGFFDGDYWRQLSESGRRGFVEGYLACYTSASRSHELHDHQAEWYADKLSSFYCFIGNTCADVHASEGERAAEKIAIVLQRLGAQ